MEKKTIVIGINSLTSAMFPAYTNHMQLMYKLGRQYKDKFEFVLCNPPRMSIDRMRNMAAEVALQINAAYLVFIDDDVIVPFNFLDNFLESIIKDEVGIVCGNVQIRGYPFDYMMFRWDEKKTGLFTLKELPSKNEPFTVDAVGFSCVIIDVEKVLRKVFKPFFITTANMTEDVTFCLRVQNELPNVKMLCDPRVICGHILWPEIISEFNRDIYTEYYEKHYPEEVAAYRNKEKQERDRGKQYYESLRSFEECGALSET
ncbi:MAG: glycosyltransferase [Patescibacteria group bacterium]|nr:glycosyltransferase [Patescibacteria group bacterium]